MAAVNCQEQQALCQQHGIRGYPTIKALDRGRWHEWSGERNAAALKAWALGLLPQDGIAVVSPSSGTDLDALLRTCQLGGGSGSASKWGLCVLLLTPKHDTSALYKSLALRYKGKVTFGEARGASVGSELVRNLGMDKLPALLAFCTGDRETAIRYEGEACLAAG